MGKGKGDLGFLGFKEKECENGYSGVLLGKKDLGLNFEHDEDVMSAIRAQLGF